MNSRIHQHGSKVFARRCHADGNSLHCTLEPAVQHGRNIFCLGYGNGALSEVHAAMLRTLETLPVLPAFEAGKSHCMRVAEEILVGSIKVADRIQEGL